MTRRFKLGLIGVWLLSGSWVLRAQPVITEYTVPTAGSSPAGIATGPDGNPWFTESSANQIATVTTNGVITEFPIPTPNSQPWAITAGPDGNLWFTEIAGHKIGRITTTGSISEYDLPKPIPGQPPLPNYIVAGPDGNLWFTEQYDGRIGKITTGGVISEYLVPGAYPTGITVGPDGNLWFTTLTNVREISTAGVITQYPLIIGLPVTPYTQLGLRAIAKGSDSNLWVTGGATIWRVGASGAVASYSASADGGITAGADGNLWFTDSVSNTVSKLTTSGVITQYTIPTAGSQGVSATGESQTGSIVSGPDGNIWFIEQGANKIAKLVLPTVPADNLLNITPSTLTFSSLAPPNLAAPTQTLTVTTPSSAAYTVSAKGPISPSWLTISPSGSLSGNQTITVSLNPKNFNYGTFGPYTGEITFVSGNVTQNIPVTLNITRPVGPQRISSLINAASGATGVIAPGEIVSIFGTSLGPVTPVGLALDSSGKVEKLLGGVSVDINGYLAPLAYVSSTQINCVVPYEIAGSSAANVQVFYLNQSSPALSLRVADTLPGIFTLNGSGTGLAAVLNGSGGLNGPANPVSAGGYITFYLTGEGATSPVSTTGGVTALNSSANGPLTPQPQAPLTVSLGGTPAQIAFYGEAPSFVAGLLQVNAQIPDGLTAGSQPLVVSLGNAQSQSGVTVAVQ